jgi:hypothetical protein
MLLCSEEHATGLYPCHMNLIYILTPYFFILILFCLRIGLYLVSSLQFFLDKNLEVFLIFLKLTTCPTYIIFLRLLVQKYLLKNTNYHVTDFGVSFGLCLNILFSILFSEILTSFSTLNVTSKKLKEELQWRTDKTNETRCVFTTVSLKCGFWDPVTWADQVSSLCYVS